MSVWITPAGAPGATAEATCIATVPDKPPRDTPHVRHAVVETGTAARAAHAERRVPLATGQLPTWAAKYPEERLDTTPHNPAPAAPHPADPRLNRSHHAREPH